jgi:hypothetical protein
VGVSTLQGPDDNEEFYERLVAAEVVAKKKEKNETKSENVVEHGSAAIASESHECGAERGKVEEKLLREKGNAEPGHSFFETSSRGPGVRVPTYTCNDTCIALSGRVQRHL